ncbi:MAG: hypothetical protein WC875_03355 [Candidatus Absconditabacterales bacterium]
MNKISKVKGQAIIKQLIAAGYTVEESEKILQGHKEAKDKKGDSAEVIYKRLLAKKEIYA